MDEGLETQDELPGVVSVGERLREARLAHKLEIEDIAARTRVPKRHLENLERGEWSRLPAPTYTMGFAKAYAGEVGLDREDIANQLRAELGEMTVAPVADGHEVADPARRFPRWLIWLALLGLVGAVAWFVFANERRLGADDGNAELLLDQEDALVETVEPVLLTANSAVDIKVVDGDTVLYEGTLASGQSFEVPAEATAPMLTVSDAGALRVSIGTASAPPLGAMGASLTNISLLGEALMAGPQAQATIVEPAATPSATSTGRTATSTPAARPAPRRTPAPAPRPRTETAPAATSPADSDAAPTAQPATPPASQPAPEPDAGDAD